jgi:hypothetical protein
MSDNIVLNNHGFDHLLGSKESKCCRAGGKVNVDRDLGVGNVLQTVSKALPPVVAIPEVKLSQLQS